jgi:hypothetical protein
MFYAPEGAKKLNNNNNNNNIPNFSATSLGRLK